MKPGITVMCFIFFSGLNNLSNMYMALGPYILGPLTWVKERYNIAQFK